MLFDIRRAFGTVRFTLVRCLSLFVIAASGCSSTEKVCTLQLLTAVRVRIESLDGLPITDVRLTSPAQQNCFENSAGATDTSVEYDCYEQGGGIYTVRVTSGTMTWTQSVSVAADECHVTEQKTLQFVLDSASAD
ncbi:MAG TPA: hypothetical protein VFQ35_21465 [Polyangiaceae bacterium]|nr:hypothetical protein [Polyangiaceae bacterium]